MTNKRSDIILNIIKNIAFSNEIDLKSRVSKLTFKENRLALLLDITGIPLEKAKLIQSNIEKAIFIQLPELETNIVLTSNSTNKPEGKPKLKLDNVKKIYLVASGKGGVGKSTIATLMAYKLKKMGKKVGVLDADIYGPSIPDLFGINEKPELDNKRMKPLNRHGIQINSIGFISAPESAVSFRGPMASKALYQLMSLTRWDNLDCLIIDSPPGTGDIHLSLLQNYQIDEVYMVTTPQLISKSDVQRAINLYKKFNIKIAGVIENMSYLQTTQQNHMINIFAGNAGEDIAKKFNIPLMAKVPVIPELSAQCDKGLGLEKFTYLIDSIFLEKL
ncbi:MAG TPA: Mrp/NBP35 family ATP-binding protein [Candidatus Megaira endosymbiont of Nemacystus decipiens]|nr:Mrp/NBP35 family ATP-binding protein [Candidatus Megaera endosymbiont of Nemacystus decipiens]